MRTRQVPADRLARPHAPRPQGALAIALSLVPPCSSGRAAAKTSQEGRGEGEPLELGELKINVQITRFLNPNRPPRSTTWRASRCRRLPARSTSASSSTIHNEGLRTPSAADRRRPQRGRHHRAGVRGAPEPHRLTLRPRHPPSRRATSARVPGDRRPPAGPPRARSSSSWFPSNVGENRPLELEINYRGENGTIELDL